MKNILSFLLCLGFIFFSFAVKGERKKAFDTITNYVVDEYRVNDSSFIYTELICSQINSVKNKLETSDTLQANQLYLQTRGSLEKYLYAIENTERNWVRRYDYIEKLPEKAEQLIRQMEECNIEIRYVGGGESELIFNPFFYYNLFKDYVSKEFLDYIEIKARQNVVFSADAAVVVEWEEIGLYVIDWEMFIKNYPSSVFKKEAIDEYIRYMHLYLFGDYNSPVIDSDNPDIIRQDIRLEFNDFLKKYPDSNSAKTLTFYMEEMKNDNGIKLINLQEKVRKFMENLKDN